MSLDGLFVIEIVSIQWILCEKLKGLLDET